MTTERAAESSAKILPTVRRDRIEVLDALRGFALFGVIVVNMSVDTIWSDELVTRPRGEAALGISGR